MPLVNCSEIKEHHYEYDGNGRVIVSLKTETGDVVRYTVTAAVFMQSINLAEACFNANLSRILSDFNEF
jgi:hypothetical protein